MATNSLCDEMEPRVLRPLLPPKNPAFLMEGQVSEPSLLNINSGLPHYKEAYNPRMAINQSSPVRSPAFIPQVTPLSILKSSGRTSNNSREDSLSYEASPCSCKSNGCNSPSIDPEIKELIQDQNKQLQLLRQQVEQLLQYQEKLQDKGDIKEKFHESTQTSFHSTPRTPVIEKSPVIPPLYNNHSPSSRLAQDRTELTFTFRDLQLETIIEQPPSPQASFVVNMQEYQDSVADRSEESLSDSCVNVMEHVQRLLAQANQVENKQKPFIERTQAKQNVLENPVRKVTIQRVQEMGISFLAPSSNNVHRNLTNYPQMTSKPNFLDPRKETDQSVEMQRLADKYLGGMKFEAKKINHLAPPTKPVEMSLSSQQYLQRYGLQTD